jgi:hypothetical protein
MSYVITHKKRNGYLNSFHSNGGWEIGDVFPFSTKTWSCFKTEKEAQDKILDIIEDCKKQQERWGDWTDIALEFAKNLEYKKR